MFNFRRSTLLAGLPALGLTLAGLALAGEAVAPSVLRPIEAGSFALGATHLLAAYVVEDGRCVVTAMIEERVDDAPSASPARIRFDLAPGGRATVENAGGAGVALVCGADAATLQVEPNTKMVEIASRLAN